MLGQGQDILYLFHGTAHQVGNVFRSGILAVVMLGFQVVFAAQDLVQFAHHVHGQAHRARLVHDGPLDALAYPPGGIGGKTEPAFRLELVDGPHQADVALLDHVEQDHAAVDVMLGDRNDQAQIVLDHGLPGFEVALLGQSGVMHLLRRRQQRPRADLVQIVLRGIGRQLGRQHFFQFIDTFDQHADAGHLRALACVDGINAVEFAGIVRHDFVCPVFRQFRLIVQLIVRRVCHCFT